MKQSSLKPEAGTGFPGRFLKGGLTASSGPAFLCLFLLTALLLSCGSPDTAPGARDRAEPGGSDPVREVIRSWAAALNRRPLEVASSYTPDALLFQPETAPIAGAEAIEAHLAEWLAGLTSFTYHSDERTVDTRLAYERGRFVVALEGRDPLVGHVFHVLVPGSDGGWRIAREVWVPVPPAAVP